MILLRKIISGRTGYMKIMNLALNLNISLFMVRQGKLLYWMAFVLRDPIKLGDLGDFHLAIHKLLFI